VRIVAVALLSALALSGCSIGEPALAEILDVSGDASHLALVELSSGEQSLEEIARNYDLGEKFVEESGFVGAWQAYFQSPHGARGMLFDDAAGASRFVRALRAKFEAGEYGAARAIDATAFGDEALGYALGAKEIQAQLYLWPVGKIVLEAYGPPENAWVFAELLMERAEG
jgi:hypothetical protein